MITSFVKFDKEILVLFHCSWQEFWKLKFCYISFHTWQLFTRDQLFESFFKYQFTTSWGFQHEVWRHTFQTPYKQTSKWTFFHRMAAKPCPNLQHFFLFFLHWRTFMLVTFLLPICLFNSHFIPKPKSTLLTSFQFVLSATSSFISKLAFLALSSTSFLINFAHNDLRSVLWLSARKEIICLSVWYTTRTEISVLAMPSKTVTLGRLQDPSE